MSENCVRLNPQKQQSSSVPIWIYVIFRKNPSSGHEKMTTNESMDGPVFWDRHVVYVFCCSCHFDKHERDLIQLLDKSKNRIERICLVDRPVDYAFLPDSLFVYMANYLPKLQFVYLRELDLEKINRATVEKLSKHLRLKKLIVHGCRNFEALQDFHNLPQLLVVKGEIIGLKAMIGDLADYGNLYSSSSESSKSVGSVMSSPTTSSNDRPLNHRLTFNEEQQRISHTPSSIATVD